MLSRLLELHPKYIDLSLDRMWRLLDALGNPQDRLPPVVHIAGTNGKGSTLAMLKAICTANGETVHSYTSPHLVDFHERINLGGADISETALAALLDEVETSNAGEPITFFEATTAAALLGFSRHPADRLLLEVGLGGRLDATNVIERPELSVITAVSMDHEHFLGDTITAIAQEKAGILKSGIPAVIAAQNPDARAEIETCATQFGAPLIMAGQDWQREPEPTGARLLVRHPDGLMDLPSPSLAGQHQLDNAATAAMAARLLGLPETAIAEGLVNASWPGRLQRLRHGPLTALQPAAQIWLDGGHNKAAADQLADWLATAPVGQKGPATLICGMMNSKQTDDWFAAFNRLDTKPESHLAVHCLTIPDEKNSFTASELAASAQRAGLTARPFETLSQAVAAAETELILICGSLYLAGYILRENS